MENLVAQLDKIDFIDLDIDELLDSRDCAPFDNEWMRVYNEIEALKGQNGYSAESEKYNAEIRELVFRKVYKLCEDGDLAGYISDDFGMIADSRLLRFADTWLDKLINCYECARIPSGKL
ncbi:MAG: hypothetical protein IJ379_10540 [Lachnospiraceae bacterium]|nr:hypothetical protein [Lachnospiraceae bacterium]